MSERWWYVSTSRFTAACKSEDGIITDSAPILRRFVGQPVRNLERWILNRLGGVIQEMQ